MSLEEEAERQRVGAAPTERSGLGMSRGWEATFRTAAFLVLIMLTTGAMAVPVLLVAPYGLLLVLAILTLFSVWASGRMRELSIRIAQLEQAPKADTTVDPDE